MSLTEAASSSVAESAQAEADASWAEETEASSLAGTATFALTWSNSNTRTS